MGREKISLSVSTLNELCFWKENIPFLNSRRLLSTQFHYSRVCYSDASSTGCASYMLDLYNTISHKLWSVDNKVVVVVVVVACRQLSINSLSLLREAIFSSLVVFQGAVLLSSLRS